MIQSMGRKVSTGVSGEEMHREEVSRGSRASGDVNVCVEKRK